MKFKIGQYKMRNGSNATVHEVADNRLLGIMTVLDDDKIPHRINGEWTVEGKWDEMVESQFDLCLPKKKVWINLYETDTGYISHAYRTKEEADRKKIANADLSARLCVEYESCS